MFDHPRPENIPVNLVAALNNVKNTSYQIIFLIQLMIWCRYEGRWRGHKEIRRKRPIVLKRSFAQFCKGTATVLVVFFFFCRCYKNYSEWQKMNFGRKYSGNFSSLGMVIYRSQLLLTEVLFCCLQRLSCFQKSMSYVSMRQNSEKKKKVWC